MGVFGVFFGCRGDAGFIGPLLWVCSGVVGFNVAMFLSPVRDVIRPALPGVWVRARKSSPCVLTMAKSWRLMARRASFFAEMRLEGLCWASFVADQHSWDPAGRVCCAAGLVAAHLLAVLTLQCAAKTYWWCGGQPAHATTYRVNVRIKGAAQTQVRAAPHKQSAQCSPSCSFRRS